ncbi:hypothetical protein L208DRAFT_1377384 [Tricholoma matsutake]|nr:hypothetical protein L208DRAFT_1377384 [Tricholoma matsutake 945]
MPGLPKLSSQNCLLLTPTQFVTASRASSKALGPQGSKMVWYQPPNNNSHTYDNSNIDPQLLNEPVTTATHPIPQQEWSFGNDAGGLVNANPRGPNLAPQFANAMERNPPGNTPGPQCGPKPSSASHEAIENASKAVSKLPQKCSLADTLMEIQWENLAAQKAQN